MRSVSSLLAMARPSRCQSGVPTHRDAMHYKVICFLCFGGRTWDHTLENTHYSSIHRAYSSLDFANFSNVRRHKSVDDPRFIWTKQDSADIRVLVDQHVKLRKQFSQLQKLDASAFDGVTEYREAGMNALPERDIETYGLESRANITKFRKGFELYLKRRDRLTKIITDLSTDLEMMKHVRLIQNKEIKRQVKTKMQKIIDGLFVDPATIQIDQRDLKYENVYFGWVLLIISCSLSFSANMTWSGVSASQATSSWQTLKSQSI